jgi:hypothetical protein
MNSVTASAALNFQLTSYASGVWNDVTSVMSFANRIAPPVPVPGSNGQYKDFSDKNSFKKYSTKRALGGDPTVIAFEAADAYFNCAPQALEARVDKEEDRQAGAVEGNPMLELTRQLLDQGKIRALMNATAIAHAFDVATYVLANTVATVGLGRWDDDELDPVDQINSELLAISLAVGSTIGIKLTMDLSVWSGLRRHPKVKERLRGVQAEEISVAQLKAMLDIDVDVEIHNIVFDASALDVAADKRRMLAGVVLIHYSVPNPTVYDPSAFKTFTVGPGALMTGVRTYYPPNGLYRGHLLDWSRDIKKTGSLCVRRIDVTLPA